MILLQYMYLYLMGTLSVGSYQYVLGLEDGSGLIVGSYRYHMWHSFLNFGRYFALPASPACFPASAAFACCFGRELFVDD